MADGVGAGPAGTGDGGGAAAVGVSDSVGVGEAGVVGEARTSPKRRHGRA